MTDPIAAVGGAPTSPTKASSLGGLGKDAFLGLLVAQLKYQNPLSPTDPTAMMGQTAQFTMVEKLEQLATSLSEQVLSSRTALAASTLGKTVTAGDVTGTVTAVSLSGPNPTLTVGERQIPLSSVTQIR